MADTPVVPLATEPSTGSSPLAADLSATAPDQQDPGTATTASTSTLPARATCQTHPATEAIGVCTRCKRRICGECVTRIDGINHCTTCLASLAKPVQPAGEAPSSTSQGRANAALVGYFVLLFLLTLGLLSGAQPFGP